MAKRLTKHSKQQTMMEIPKMWTPDEINACRANMEWLVRDENDRAELMGILGIGGGEWPINGRDLRTDLRTYDKDKERLKRLRENSARKEP